MAELSKFLGRQSGHMLRNAMAGAEIQITSATNVVSDGVVVTNVFGGLGVTALASNAVSFTFSNASSAATPVFAAAAHGSLDATAVAASDQRFVRMGGTATNSAAAGLFAGADTAIGTFHLMVFGAIQGGYST